MAPWLKKRPTEYFAEQCYLSFDPDERTLAAMCELRFDQYSLGSDSPHFDCAYSGVVKQIEQAVKVLPEAARHNIMTANPTVFIGSKINPAYGARPVRDTRNGCQSGFRRADHHHAGLVADCPRSMTLSSQFLRQNTLAGSETVQRAVA